MIAYKILRDGSFEKTASGKSDKIVKAGSTLFKKLIKTLEINTDLYTPVEIVSNRYYIIKNGEKEKTGKGKNKTTKHDSATYKKYIRDADVVLEPSTTHAYLQNTADNTFVLDGKGNQRKFLINSTIYVKMISMGYLSDTANEEIAENEEIVGGAMPEFPVAQEPTGEPSYELERRDRFHDFRQYTYQINNVSNYETFYDILRKIIEEQFDGRNDIKIKLSMFLPKKDEHEQPTSEARDVRHITIKAQNWSDFNRFETFLERLSSGETKSDPIENGTTIDMSRVVLEFFSPQGRGGKPKPMFAKQSTSRKNAGDSLCLFEAVFSQIEYDESRPVDKNITELFVMEKILKEKYDTSLVVYGDFLSSASDENAYKKKYENIVVKQMKKNKAKEWVDIELYVTKLDSQNLHVYHDMSEESSKTVSVVYFMNHFIPYRGVKDGDFYMDENKCTYYIKNGKIKQITKRRSLTDRLIELNLKDKTEVKFEICGFDFETVYDKNELGLLKPYSINWIFEGINYQYNGFDCAEKFADFLMDHTEDRLICLLGYNSSRFDNYFLLEPLMKRDLLTNVFFQGNSILNIKWGGRHTVHDICRFTACSLEKACNDFKCKYKKIGDSIDHNKVQKHYRETGQVKSFFHEEGCPLLNKEEPVIDTRYITQSKFVDSIILKEVFRHHLIKHGCRCEKNHSLVCYNAFDVLSTVELYENIEDVLHKCGVIIGKLFDKKTIGAAIFSKFTRDLSTKGIKLPELNESQYKSVRSGLIAGRTQCYKGMCYDLSRNNLYKMIDAVSLYPSAMLNNDYPDGDIIKIPLKECLEKELIGFYKVTFEQSSLKVKIIAHRVEGKPLDWNYDGEITIFLNTVDIRLLLQYGVRVTEIEDEDNFAFSEKIKGRELFSCLDEIKKGKQEEDNKKAVWELRDGKLSETALAESENLPIWMVKNMDLSDIWIAEMTGLSLDFVKTCGRYNAAKRNMYKLLLNSLSGKVIENIHLDAVELVRTEHHMDEIRKKATEDSNLKDSLELSARFSDRAGIVTYKKSFESEFKRQNRPIYLGVLIYAYARAHMYRCVLHDFEVLYQDTDSAFMHDSEYRRFIVERGYLFGKEFGQFALEENAEKFDSFFIHSPKNYVIFGMDGDKHKPLKKGFKGVNINRDKFIADPDFLVEAGYLYKRVVVHTDKITGEKTQSVQYNISMKNAEMLYHNEILGADKKPILKTVYDDIDLYVETIKKSEAIVLTSSILKTSRKVGEYEAGGMYQRYLIKQIKNQN